MKTTIFNSFFLLCTFCFCSVFLFSCKSDEPSPEARILVTPESSTIEIGQTALFQYSVDSKINLKEIKISTKDKILQTITTNFLTPTKHEGEFDLTGKRTEIGKIIEITIDAMDTDNNSTKRTVLVKVNDASTLLVFKEYTVTLGAQANTEKGSFLDVNAGESYNLEDAKVNGTKLQLVYGYDQNKKAIIGSPNDATINTLFTDTENGLQTWTFKNQNRFKATTLTKADYDAITDGRIIREAYSEGTKPANTDGEFDYASQINNLTRGSIFLFQTTAGKEGLVYVSEVTQGGTGTITLLMKVVR